MPTTYRTIRVFISSPRDVHKERDKAVEIIESISKTCKRRLGLAVEAVTWSDLIPRASRLPGERIQDILNREVPGCEIFLLTLWKRYGSMEPGHEKSNTQREVEVALDLIRRQEDFTLLSYFKRLPHDEDPGKQRTDAEKFRADLKSRGVFYNSYTKLEEFQTLFTRGLFETILRIQFSSRKHRALQRFWVLGEPDRPTHPKLAILYPAIDRAFMGAVEEKDFWLNRLEPNIVFEDYKALAKLQKTLQLLAIRSYRIYNASDIPRDLRFMNRFWVCLPRNRRAMEQLAKKGERAWFEFVPKTRRADSLLRWRRPGHQEVTVRSPLGKYLHEQRGGMAVDGEWHRELDNIVAKDYAVLARLKEEDGVAMAEGRLQDYFLAGLRGLGSWGAAWFIDREYEWFKRRLGEGDDFQVLLEVEYRDGKIFSAQDVSDRSQAYFRSEYSVARIRKNIGKYKSP